MKNIFVFIVVTLLMISIISCKKEEVEPTIPTIGDMAPDFIVKDINGNTTRLTDYNGKIVLVEFWATWCPPCKELIPVLTGLYKKYKNKGLVILSLVSENEGNEAIRSFVKEYKITYPVLFTDNIILRRYGISNIPVSFIINKEGRIVNKHLGYVPNIENELMTEIKGLL